MQNPNRVKRGSRVEQTRRTEPKSPEATGGDTTRGSRASAPVVVVASTAGSVDQFESWLSSTYETELGSLEELISSSVSADVVVTDRQTLAPQGVLADGPAARLAETRQIIVEVAAEQAVWYADDSLLKPVNRDELVNAVETARRIAAYDDTIEELVSLTARRRASQEFSTLARANDGPGSGRLSEQIDELHSRIDDTLARVEGGYSELLSRKGRPLVEASGESHR